MTPMNQSEISYERFLNPTLAGLKPSGIRRFFAIASEMEDVITLSIGEPVLPPRGISVRKAFSL